MTFLREADTPEIGLPLARRRVCPWSPVGIRLLFAMTVWTGCLEQRRMTSPPNIYSKGAL